MRAAPDAELRNPVAMPGCAKPGNDESGPPRPDDRDTELEDRRPLAAIIGKLTEARTALGIYACLLLSGAIGCYSLYWHHNGWPAGFVPYLGLLLPTCVEVVLFWCIGRLLIGGRGLRGHPLRSALFLGNALVFSVLMPVQCYALLYSNSFISVLALENVAEARLAASVSQPVLVAAAVLASFVLAIACHRGIRSGRDVRRPGRGYVVATAAVLAGAAVFATNKASPVADGAGGLRPGQSPVAAMLLTTWRQWRLYHDDSLPVVDDDVPYPYLKDWINRDPLPFRGAPPVRQPNVIVLFIEGMSARVLDPYGGPYPGLTPNLQAMAGDTMVVDNYYNHTAATYRGLQGQMTSGFPRYGGSEGGKGWMDGENAQSLAKRSYSSLAGILHDAGYHTVFFAPHPASSALNSLIAMLDFDELYNRERSVETLLHDDPVQPFIRAALTDHDLFLALQRYLENADHDQPFFVGLYNIGTHAFLDVDAHGQKYGDGSNHSLNTIHNLDAQFGRFYRWFVDSPYADNTILIFTSDHAHYPEPSYVAIANDEKIPGDHYDPYFVDRIPMFVRAPWLQMPPRFDAHDRTSLGLAPTVLSLLDIDRAPNSFLGQSIFRPYDGDDPGLRIAALGLSMYAIFDGRVYAPSQVPQAAVPRYNYAKLRARQYYALETAGRIFPPHDGEASQLVHAQSEAAALSESRSSP